MATQYAVLHTEKGKATGGGLGNHIDRVEGMEHTYQHADEKRRNLNQDFTSAEFKDLTIPQAIQKRISTGYTKTRKIRSDAVKYLSTVLTGSHDQMMDLKRNGQLDAWIRKNKEFMEEEFGKDNIVRFVLHLDEKTPHIHCVHVPIDEQGGLSAKKVMGDKFILKKRQDRYAEAMKPFKLERGQARKGVFHETANEYYRRINIVEEYIQEIASGGFNRSIPNGSTENYKKVIREHEMKLISLESDLEHAKNRENIIKQAKRKVEKELEALESKFIDTILDPKKTEIMRKTLAKVSKEIDNNEDIDKKQGRGFRR